MSPDAYALGKRFAASLSNSFFTPAFTQQLQQQIHQQLGLQVSNHTFTVSRYGPWQGSGTVENSRRAGTGTWAAGQQQRLQCTNVHTVLESRRGDGKESLVLVTPVNHQQYVTGEHELMCECSSID